MIPKIPEYALAAYTNTIRLFWEIDESFRKDNPHPNNWYWKHEESPYSVKEWEAKRDEALEPANKARRELEELYPGIGDEYEERRYQACAAAEDRWIQSHYE